MQDQQTSEIAIIVPERESLPPSLLSNIEAGFKASFEQAEKWRQQALSINVTSLDQRAEMKLARTIRLELKNTRVAADKTRKVLKADALMMGRAIDGVFNLLEASIVPLERHLDEQEKFAERLAEAERQRILAERAQAITPYLSPGQIIPALDAMAPNQWESYLSDAKLLHEARIEAARKAEAERIAREQAEAAERERLRIENERLMKEAAEREAQAKAEREAAAKAQREAEEKARKEREALEAQAKAEREAAERELARIRAEAQEAARKEAERQAAIQAAERAKAQQEREAREKLEREMAAKAAAEEADHKKAAAAARKAANAPDKAKILSVATAVRALPFPTVTTDAAVPVLADVKAKAENFAKWIETQAAQLD